MSKKTFIATTRIMHDNEVYEPGDAIDLEEDTGEKQRLAGRVKPAGQEDGEGNTSPDTGPAKKGNAKKPTAKKPDGGGDSQADGGE